MPNRLPRQSRWRRLNAPARNACIHLNVLSLALAATCDSCPAELPALAERYGREDPAVGLIYNQVGCLLAQSRLAQPDRNGLAQPVGAASWSGCEPAGVGGSHAPAAGREGATAAPHAAAVARGPQLALWSFFDGEYGEAVENAQSAHTVWVRWGGGHCGIVPGAAACLYAAAAPTED